MGALIWSAIYSGTDWAYSVEVLSRFCSKPWPTHDELVKYVLRYVFGTLQLGLKFDGEEDTPDDVIRYTDSTLQDQNQIENKLEATSL